MIFLGAGAAKPFGIPTLEEFSKDTIDKLKKFGHIEVLERIEKSLKEFQITLDFEALYSILEGLINLQQSVKYAGPLTAFLVQKKKNLPENYDYSEVLNDLRKIMYAKCSIDSYKFSQVKRCYDSLFHATRNVRSSESIYGNRWDINISKVLVTTNYDTSLEDYFNKLEKPITDGFESAGAFVKNFNPLILFNPYESSNKSIIQLHGSIRQFSREEGIIKTTIDPTSEALPYKINVEREMMIYPTKEKDILIQPFFSFFRTFKSITWSKLLVIGYSFRDEPINTAILENMIRNDKSRLIVINPNADDVVENLYSNSSRKLNWKIPKHRLFKKSGKFGTEEVIKYISYLSKVNEYLPSSFDPSILE